MPNNDDDISPQLIPDPRTDDSVTLYPHGGEREWSTVTHDEWKRDLGVEMVRAEMLQARRVRSQGLDLTDEEIAVLIDDGLPVAGHEWHIFEGAQNKLRAALKASVEASNRQNTAAALGLPDEEGEGHDDSGYEARSAHPGDCVPSPDVAAPLRAFVLKEAELMGWEATEEHVAERSALWREEVAAAVAALPESEVVGALTELHDLAEMRLTGIHQPTKTYRRAWERDHPYAFVNAISRARTALAPWAAGPVAEAPEGAEAISQDVQPSVRDVSGEGER